MQTSAMQSRVLMLFAMVAVIPAMAGRTRRRPLDLSPGASSTDKEQPCKTKDGRTGICVHEGQCSEDHRILPGGVLDDSEIRAGVCPKRFDWCCVKVTEAEVLGPSQVNRLSASGCTLSQYKECPWCVAIYRNGGNPRTKSPSGLFCGGILVGSNVVLTSANCVLSAQGQEVWIQVPSISTPRNYTVKSQLKHPNHNSGTREYDIALMTLSEEVVTQEGTPSKGGCVDLRTPLQGDCLTAGFDKEDRLILTRLQVTSGSCNNRSTVADAVCGRTDNTCVVQGGHPVLCPATGGLISVGVARQVCSDGAATLGALLPSASWLSEELSKAGVKL